MKNRLTELIKMDIKRWGDRSVLNLFFLKREFRLVLRLRLCQFLRNYKAAYPLYCVERLIYHHSTSKCGCDIPSSLTVGGGFQLLHSWGTVINSKAVIGENCTILSGCVIGSNKTGVPTIGDNVYIGTKATILGGIRVGNNAKIGANALVIDDVPDNGVVVGHKGILISK